MVNLPSPRIKANQLQLKAHWNNAEIYLHQGDITRLEVDAVVNAANRALAGGGGVDGAIHRRGGPRIMDECDQFMQTRGGQPLRAGEVAVTGGGEMPCKHVIHAVGPIYRQYSPDEAARLLADCYRASLQALAARSGNSIAFPCISTGVYGYPSQDACGVVLQAVRDELSRLPEVAKVIFCTFEPYDFDLYERAFTADAA